MYIVTENKFKSLIVTPGNNTEGKFNVIEVFLKMQTAITAAGQISIFFETKNKFGTTVWANDLGTGYFDG